MQVSGAAPDGGTGRSLPPPPPLSQTPHHPREHHAVTLEQLRIFVAVAEQLHVTRAAATLNITQSAASAAVQALEASTGTLLLHRIGRHIELTGAGALLLTEARAVLGRAASAQQALDDLAGLRRGNLALYASQTIASYWLPPRMHQFRQAHPGIALTLRIGNTAQVEQAVLAGDAELGFVEGATSNDLLVRADVATDHLRLVLSPALAAGSGTAPRAILPHLTWVMREPGSGTRALHERALQDLGLALIAPPLELPSNEAVLSAVLAGAGATILSALVVDTAIAAGRLLALDVALPTRPFTALRHADRYRSAAAASFLALAGKQDVLF